MTIQTLRPVERVDEALFSFLICVHRDHEFLEQAIQSVIDQEYRWPYNIVIVVNNGTDELWQKIAKYQSSNENIDLIRVQLGQHAFGLNIGAELINTDYIIRMDSDDICMLDRLKKTHETIIAHPNFDVYSFGGTIINENGNFVKTANIVDQKTIKTKLLYKNCIMHPASCIRRRSLYEAGGYAGGLTSEDYDLWLRMRRKGMGFYSSPEPVIFYRIHTNQAAGGLAAYADSLGYAAREFVLRPSMNNFLSILYKISKTVFRYYSLRKDN